MGHLIKQKATKSLSKTKKIDVKASVVIGHKAKVLTSADVEANRSRAYKYLTL